jgi:hypothetical protein
MSESGSDTPEFAAVARLYLGNVLYALEVTALGIEQEGRLEDAAFYRGIARELTEAFRRESASAGGSSVQ